MTENFKRGFMDKMAETEDLSLSFITPFMGGHPPATTGMRSLTGGTGKDLDVVPELPSGVKLEQTRKPNWFQRNPWIFKPLVNALSIRYGSGSPVTGFQFRF